MQTNFTAAQLADPDIRESESILRKCVHCGFCTATCPTYVLLGDELDSPRGRIYLMKEMLEQGKVPTEDTVKHVDRCLPCLSCVTTCPSGVNYMHLVDHGRAYIEAHYRRPLFDRVVRSLLAFVLPSPTRFRLALVGALLARPVAKLIPGRLGAMLRLAPTTIHGRSAMDRPQVFPAQQPVKLRVAILTGCAQQVLSPDINEATIRLLTRLGCEVAIAPGAGCCGALTHHLGREHDAKLSAAANIKAWTALWDGRGPDRIVINASGCGTMVKDYGFLFRTDATLADTAARVSAMARDVSEVIAELGIGDASAPEGLTVAHHQACSLQHGQKITTGPAKLLAAAGFTVKEVPEGHLCCGSAGTYNLLQPDLAAALRDRKLANIARVRPDVIAAGNIGCITQLASEAGVPVVHTVELLDWATGGPRPAALH
jgi:glycolate oxidase iron-sulfur subunit